MIDFFLTDDFDLALMNRDLIQTENITQYRRQQIKLRLQTALKEWVSSPYMGAGLNEFRGQEINAKLVKNIETNIIRCLLVDELFRIEDFQIKFKLEKNRVLILIVFKEGLSIPPFKYELHQVYGMKPIGARTNR